MCAVDDIVTCRYLQRCLAITRFVRVRAPFTHTPFCFSSFLNLELHVIRFLFRIGKAQFFVCKFYLYPYLIFMRSSLLEFILAIDKLVRTTFSSNYNYRSSIGFCCNSSNCLRSSALVSRSKQSPLRVVPSGSFGPCFSSQSSFVHFSLCSLTQAQVDCP